MWGYKFNESLYETYDLKHVLVHVINCTVSLLHVYTHILKFTLLAAYSALDFK